MHSPIAAPPISDSEATRLVSRFQAGDKGAFERLYVAYFGSVYAYLELTLRDAHEAEDATQQVFAAVLENLPRYEDRGKPFRAWLFTIARHRGLTARRARQVRAEVVDPTVLERTRDCAAIALPPMAIDDALLRAIGALPQAQRQILFLRFAFDFQHDEIAVIVGRSPEAVRQLLTRALKTLRTRLNGARPSQASSSLTLKAA